MQSHWVAHPMKPIVSLMNRQDLIKTFQTSFGPQCGAKRLPRRAQLTPRWSEAGGLLLPLKGEPTNHSNAFSRGLSCRLCYPLSFPLSLVVKNSLDAVCIASSRISLLMADCVGKGRFRRPEGIDGAPSVCWGTFCGFDACISSQYSRHAQTAIETHKWLNSWPQTVTPEFSCSLITCVLFISKVDLENVWIAELDSSCCCVMRGRLNFKLDYAVCYLYITILDYNL